MYFIKRILQTILFTSIFLCLSFHVNAQARYIGEFGILGGDSYYNGDANSTKIFIENHVAFGGFIRAHITDRCMLKVNVIRGGASGDTRNFENLLPKGQQADFTQKFWDIGLHVEHNFLKYGMSYWDREMKRHTPYILIGPGLTIYDQWSGSQLTFNLTFGVGYKFKICERLNLGVEWSMRKLFVDDFDVTNVHNKILNDPYKMGHSWIKNNDYYTCAYVFLSVDFLRRKGACRTLQF
ncbi:MAG: DUF6089 family protein [Bacteroidales bacterium]|nr:DUF6089 family protein [Bacteroidales bacterium]